MSRRYRWTVFGLLGLVTAAWSSPSHQLTSDSADEPSLLTSWESASDDDVGGPDSNCRFELNFHYGPPDIGGTVGLPPPGSQVSHFVRLFDPNPYPFTLRLANAAQCHRVTVQTDFPPGYELRESTQHQDAWYIQYDGEVNPWLYDRLVVQLVRGEVWNPEVVHEVTVTVQVGPGSYYCGCWPTDSGWVCNHGCQLP